MGSFAQICVRVRLCVWSSPLWWDLEGIKMTNRSVKISYLRAVQLLSLILLSINNVHADGEADNVSVVEGIPVPSDGVNIDVADDRIDLGFEDDQIAEESHLTETDEIIGHELLRN